MIRHSLMVVAFVMSLAACAAMEAPGSSTMPGSRPEAFAHRVATSEVVLLWNCLEPEPGLLRVAGVAQNPWQVQPIDSLEFDLMGVDAQERTTAQTAGAARDLQIRANQSTSFQLTLKSAGTEVRFDLYYRYFFGQEFDGRGFDTSALVAGPPMAGPRLLAATQTFLVRDACGATQHRAG
jgi:hypothetical protein